MKTLKKLFKIAACGFALIFALSFIAYLIDPQATEAKRAENTPATAASPALPEVKVTIGDVIPGMKFSADCLIQKQVDAETLEKMAAKVYTDNKADQYENVFVLWWLPHYTKGAGAWASTNRNGKDGKMVVKITRMQDMQKIYNNMGKLADGELEKLLKIVETAEPAELDKAIAEAVARSAKAKK